jgi:hypothetical protein
MQNVRERKDKKRQKFPKGRLSSTKKKRREFILIVPLPFHTVIDAFRVTNRPELIFQLLEIAL